MLRGLTIFAVAALSATSASSADPPSTNADGNQGVLWIRFADGEIPENLVDAISRLVDARLLDVATHEVKTGDTYCGVFRETLGVGEEMNCTRGAIDLGRRLNPELKDLAKLQPGQTIRVPKRVPIATKNVTQQYDLTQKNDVERWEADRTKWNITPKRSGAIAKLEARQYDLVLFTNQREAATKVAQDIQVYGAKGTFADFVPLKSERVGFPQSRNSFFEQSLKDCSEGRTAQADRAYTALLGATSPPACAKKCTEAGNCPRVLMLDTPVVMHSGLAGALLPSPDLRPAKKTGNKCTPIDFARNIHHGTHLAGIIASRANRFIGIAPASKIFARDYSKFTEDVLLDSLIGELADEVTSEPRIVLFSNRFAPYAPGLIKDKMLREETTRIDKKLPAKSVLYAPHLLWVVSAGQPEESDEQPIDIYERSPLAPQNLGDQHNVVVVAACSDCSDQAASLSKWSNRSSKGFVHVVAPGEDLPGMVDSDEFARGSGTSQAAAFVAGVAAQMVACTGPLTPSQLKLRLQVTSRPVLDEASRRFVTGGVIDPEVAGLDQRKTWLKRVGDQYREIRDLEWCAPAVHLSDALGGGTFPIETGYFNTDQVLRVVINRRTVKGDPSSWVFIGAEPRKSVVRMSQPGVWGKGKRLIRYRGGAAALEEIEDLLLSKPARISQC